MISKDQLVASVWSWSQNYYWQKNLVKLNSTFIVLITLRFYILEQTNEGQRAASCNAGDCQTGEVEPARL